MSKIKKWKIFSLEWNLTLKNKISVLKIGNRIILFYNTDSSFFHSLELDSTPKILESIST